ncbi:MAG: single-stranded DNA-binding protein [candidate division Zixibacteria bacterium]|nr:single-stranded DNA-binding protein [candidate division Zixibacteria bacterium]
MSVNKVILVGRLGKDPELKYTTSSRAVVNFSLATNERWTSQDGQKQEKTTWHNIVAWGKQAEVINEYCRKGKQLYIEGRIDNRSWDKDDGTKGYISEVVVQNFQFLGDRDDASGASRPAASAPAAGAPPEPKNAADDDDLPF